MLDKTAALAPSPTAVRPVSKVPKALQRYLCLDDFEPAARKLLPKFLYGYVSGGAETDAAVRDNRRAFDEYGFVPRVLNDVSSRQQTKTLFGQDYAAPFGIPPMGSSALLAYRGDIACARAAAAQNIPMILSGVVADQAGGGRARRTPTPGTRPICRAIPRASNRWSIASPPRASRPSC